MNKKSIYAPNDNRLSHERIDLQEIQFRNYKALRQFDINLKRTNILVGPNNCGKSTIIGALRILGAGLRKANAAGPVPLYDNGNHAFGWVLNSDTVPVSLENVHTDYAETDTTIVFKFTNGDALKLSFPSTGDCHLIPMLQRKVVRAPREFRAAFPFNLAVIPVLGPLEHREQIVRKETVQQNLDTHRASRNFRNYWFQNPDGFEDFAELVRSTWPSMEIEMPYKPSLDQNEVYMVARENRMTRELFWCGFGFQIWCQLLTHISRNRDADLLVVDEPEVYLHPDIQRQLLSILRDAGPAIALATHSTEIMAEAEPADLVLIDKERESGRRLANARAVQAAFAQIGSIHNITIVKADKTRKVLFLEATSDYQILKRFATVANVHQVVSDTSVSILPSGGYGSWKEINGLAQRIEKITNEKYLVAAIYDRDYRCQEELDVIATALREHLEFAWILDRKEIENYLLNPIIIDRVVAAQLIASSRTPVPSSEIGCAEILMEITEHIRHDIFSQYTTHRNNYLRQRGKDVSVFTAETSKWFETKWSSLETRLHIVPGKETLSDLRNVINERYKVSFSDTKVAEFFTKQEIPEEIIELLDRMGSFSRR